MVDSSDEFSYVIPPATGGIFYLMMFENED